MSEDERETAAALRAAFCRAYGLDLSDDDRAALVRRRHTTPPRSADQGAAVPEGQHDAEDARGAQG